MIEKGDLVTQRGRHAAKVYFVEDFDNESILLVNGVQDEYFEGEMGIERFHKSYRLLVKAEHLIEEEKRYRVKFPGITRDGRNIYLMRQSNRDGTHGIDWSPEEYIFDDFPDGYLFTEKEIKSINEHYWHFAEKEESE